MINFKKNKLKLSTIYIFVFYSNYITAIDNKIFIISIPKAGTYLMEKLTDLLTGGLKAANTRYYYEGLLHQGLNFDNKHSLENAMQLFCPSVKIFQYCVDNLKLGERLGGHLIYNASYEKILKKNNIKVIFIIRDPRDQLISRVFYTYQYGDSRYQGLKNLSFDELLLKYIGSLNVNEYNESEMYLNWLSYKKHPVNKYVCNIGKFYRSYIPWKQSPICYTSKFEDLIGSKGLGNDITQSNEIKNIAKFLQIDIDKNKINEIASNLFGNTWTFRQGQIGSWKKHFNEEHKNAFKKVAGQLLIDLGYEKDFNW